MRIVFGLVLVAGLALAGFAVMMAQNYIGSYQAQLAEANAVKAQLVETVPVYAAKRQLKYGETLTQEDVVQIAWPANALPEGVYTEAAVLFPETTDKPRIVLRTMEQGEVLLAVKLTEPGEDAGLTSQLERGMRAFAIEVDVRSGVSGFLRPGDRVDVYWTGRVSTIGQPNAPGPVFNGDVTKLIEAGVQLIAVDQSANGEAQAATIARTVTVAVRPEQVASLAQAQNTGKLSLSLVGAMDDTIAGAIEVDQTKLLGLTQAIAPQQVAQAERCTIRTRRGAEVMQIEIPCSN